MRPKNLKTRIFLDGGDPGETREIMGILGFIDGQTTNPTLISKHPGAQDRIKKGQKFSQEEIFSFYRGVVQELSAMIPQGSVSVEVYADHSTKAEQMMAQAREMFGWIPNAHIKLPISAEGLKAAEQAIREGMKVNMTLCFKQEQAAAVHAATLGAKRGDVFVSPFIGRLDDRGENGMDLIANSIRMYQQVDSHVEVLTASVRTFDHFLYALKLGSDIITAPFKTLKEWGEKKLLLPDNDYFYKAGDLKAISYQDISLTKRWQDYDISHDLTNKGMERFSEDWNSLIG